MNNEQLPAILLILGFVSVLIASSVGPPRLYQEPSVDRQLELVAEYRTAWIVSNVFFGLAGLVTTIGFVLFSLQLRGSGIVWLASIGAIAYAFGTLAYAIFLYRRTVNPSQLFTNYTFSPLTIFLIASLMIGLLLMGVVLLQVGYPGWLGIGTVVGMVLIGGTAVFFPTQFFKSFPPQVLFLFTLMTGIVMWQ